MWQTQVSRRLVRMLALNTLLELYFRYLREWLYSLFSIKFWLSFSYIYILFYKSLDLFFNKKSKFNIFLRKKLIYCIFFRPKLKFYCFIQLSVQIMIILKKLRANETLLISEQAMVGINNHFFLQISPQLSLYSQKPPYLHFLPPFLTFSASL